MYFENVSKNNLEYIIVRKLEFWMFFNIFMLIYGLESKLCLTLSLTF